MSNIKLKPLLCEYITIVNKFTNIKSFKDKIKFAESNFHKIGAGSSRIVYDINDTLVLKLAKNKKGLAQNELEIDIGTTEYYFTGITKVIQYDENNTWLISEKASKISYSDFEKFFGIPLLHFFIYLKKGEDMGNVQNTLQTTSLGVIYDLVNDYDLAPGDIDRISSWGKTKNGLIKLVDYGFSKIL